MSSTFPRCGFGVVINTGLPFNDAVISRVPVSVNVYGPACDREAVGTELGNMDLFLQRPDYHPPGYIYNNPHYLGTVKQTDIGPADFTFGMQVMFLAIENYSGQEAARMRQLLRTRFDWGREEKEAENHRREALDLARTLTRGGIDLTPFEICIFDLW